MSCSWYDTQYTNNWLSKMWKTESTTDIHTLVQTNRYSLHPTHCCFCCRGRRCSCCMGMDFLRSTQIEREGEAEREGGAAAGGVEWSWNVRLSLAVQSSLLYITRVGFSDIHPTLYVVSPWWNRLDSVLFGPRRTGLAHPWTRYRVGPLSENPTLVLLSKDLCGGGDESVFVRSILSGAINRLRLKSPRISVDSICGQAFRPFSCRVLGSTVIPRAPRFAHFWQQIFGISIHINNMTLHAPKISCQNVQNGGLL